MHAYREVARDCAGDRQDPCASRLRCPLTVSTNQPFASLWLIPRLAHFRARDPAVDVFISADTASSTWTGRSRPRRALLPRGRAPPGAPRLFGERLLPVCSPALAADRARPIRRPEDLARHVLLHIDDAAGRYPGSTGRRGWRHGRRELSPAGSLRFTHFDQVIQAALDGQGVALGRLPLIDNLLKTPAGRAPSRQVLRRRVATSSCKRRSRRFGPSTVVHRLADRGGRARPADGRGRPPAPPGGAAGRRRTTRGTTQSTPARPPRGWSASRRWSNATAACSTWPAVTGARAYFAARGCRVTAIDRDAAALETLAESRASRR